MHLENLMRSALRLALAAGGLTLVVSSAAVAKGPPADRGPNTAPGLNRELLPEAANPNPGRGAEEAGDGASIGRTAVLGGLRAAGQQSFLRFSNLGNVAGTAHVTLFDASSGDEIAVWESASIPRRGALQVSLSEVAGSVVLDPGARYAAAVRGDFNGHVQHVGWSAEDGIVSDLTACRRLTTPNRGLGYISGPATADLVGIVRIVNEGTEDRAINLVLHNAATGETLGKWASPEISSRGALEISIDALSAAATTPVPADTPALTVSVEGSAALMSLSYTEGTSGGLTDLTAGCALNGGGAGDLDDDDENEESSGN